MKKDREPGSIPRREFLGYCGATAALLASAVSSWAAQSASLTAPEVERDLRALADVLQGDLLIPDHSGFELVRGAGWNRLVPDRHPELIVMAESRADVIAALGFARKQDWRVAVRGGGHSWCGASLRGGGLLLDLSRVRSIEIDAASRTASIDPGVGGLELIHRAAAHDLTFPIAHCPSVPMSGFLLSGGNGWNFNRWGSACSNVIGIEMVLADGRALTATHEQHEDLFWAARGAGAGFFGVVTRYQLKLHALPRAITASSYVFPQSAIVSASELVDDLSSQMSRDVVLYLVIGGPTSRDKPEAAISVGAFAYVNSPAAGAEALRPLNDDPRVRLATSSTVNEPKDLDGLFGTFGELLPGGHRYLVDNIWSNTPVRSMLVGSPEHYAKAPSSKSHIVAIGFHPEFELTGTAHSMHGRYLVFNNTLWTDPEDDVENRAWHAEATALIEAHKLGRYIGEADLSKEPGVARQCYTPGAWERLRALRSIHDPNQLFHDYLGIV